MKTPIIVKFVTFLILFSFGIQVFSQEQTHEQGDHHNTNGLSQEDNAAIKKLLDTFAKDYEAKNLDGVMAAFADHAVYLEGRGLNDGKKAIRDDRIAEHFESMTYLQYKSRDRVISGKGEVAYVYQMVTVKSKRKTRDTPLPARDMRVLYILEKQSDGSWLIALLQRHYDECPTDKTKCI